MYYLWIGIVGWLVFYSLINGEWQALAAFFFILFISIAGRLSYLDGAKQAQAESQRKSQIEEQERRIRELTLEKLEAERRKE